VRKLDEAQWPVTAAFWYFVPGDNQWKLIFASPTLETEGPKQSYEAISKAASALRDYFGGLAFISVVTPRNDMVRTLAVALQNEPRATGIRFSKNMVNGHYIDDAYVYRVAPVTAAA
jgi:hypothetical protein